MGKGTPNTSPRNAGFESGSVSDSGAKRSPRQRFGDSIQRGLSRVFNTRLSAGSSSSSPRSDDEDSADDSRDTIVIEPRGQSSPSPVPGLPEGFKLTMPDRVGSKPDLLDDSPEPRQPPQAEPGVPHSRSDSSNDSVCSVLPPVESATLALSPRQPLFLDERLSPDESPDERVSVRSLSIRDIYPNSPGNRGLFFQQPSLERLDWYSNSSLINLLTTRDDACTNDYHLSAYNLLAVLFSKVLNPAFLNISTNSLFETLQDYFRQVALQIMDVKPLAKHLDMLLDPELPDELRLIDENARISPSCARQICKEALSRYVNQLLLPFIFDGILFKNHRLHTSLTFLWKSITRLGLQAQYQQRLGELFRVMVDYLDCRLQLHKARQDLLAGRSVDDFVRLSTLLDERFVGKGSEMTKSIVDALRTDCPIIALSDNDLFFPERSDRVNQIKLSVELAAAPQESENALESSLIQDLIDLLRPEQLVTYLVGEV